MWLLDGGSAIQLRTEEKDCPGGGSSGSCVGHRIPFIAALGPPLGGESAHSRFLAEPSTASQPLRPLGFRWQGRQEAGSATAMQAAVRHLEDEDRGQIPFPCCSSEPSKELSIHTHLQCLLKECLRVMEEEL